MNFLEVLLLGGLTFLIPATVFGILILAEFIQEMGENIEEIQKQVNTNGN